MNQRKDQTTRGIVIGLKLAGLTNTAAQKKLEEVEITISLQTIQRFWQLQEQGKSILPQKASGHPQVITDKSKQQLTKYVQNNPKSSRSDIEKSSSANPQSLKGQTLVNHLKKDGFYQYKPQKVIKISETNKQKRVLLANQLIRNQIQVLRNCTYTDETWIVLSEQQQSLQWQKKDERVQIKTENEKYPQKLMMWGAIHMNGRLALKIIQGTLNQDSYSALLDDFFEKDVLEEGELYFMHDNAPPHTGAKVKQILQNYDIKQIQWASQSPDLNPIERVWSLLKLKIKQNFKNIHTIEDLQKFVNLAFFNDSDIKQLIQKSIQSIKRNLLKLIEKKGELIT